MPKFRKKPVVIEAMQVPNGASDEAMILHGALGVWLGAGGNWNMIDERGAIDIHTLEGTMRAAPGDWIIRGVKGELYPCKPDIFEATYEPA